MLIRRAAYPEVTTIDTFYTNDDGMLITPEKLEFGKGYSLKEVSAPYGYVLSHEAVKFDVTEENSTEESGVTVVAVKLGNYAQKGIIKISKTGEVFASVTAADGVYQPVYTVQGLAGATYEIKAAEDIYTPDGTLRCSAGEVVDTVTTGADGMAESKPLYLGKYEITEMKAPDGMVINKDAHTAELVYAGQEIEITETAASFCNDRQKARISLSKVLEQNKQFGIGMNNELSAVTFGFYAAEELTAADGSVIPADGLIEILSLDENGKAVLKSDVPFGSYYVKEISTDSHYILSDEKYPVIFAYAGQEIPVVELAVNDGKSITNEMIYGEIHGMKKDEDGKALAGATIGQFLTDGTEPILTTVSAEDGSFTFADIPYGEYVVREIAAPEGYVMDDTPYTVKVEQNGAVIEIEITNKLIRGSVQLTKVDKDYPDHHLNGAVFEVYRDGKLVGQMEELSDGVYKLDDLPYGDYTLKETEAPKGFFLDEKTYSFSIKEDGKTVVVENEAGKGFVNQAQTGGIRIEKTSDDGVLKGFTFRVEGTDITGNAFSKDFVTDEKGQIHIDGLRIGDYVISEVSNKANEKYELPANVTVTVHEGKTVVAKLHNKLKPVTDIPKTGDTTNMPLWAALAGISAVGTGAAAFFTFRKKKEVINSLREEGDILHNRRALAKYCYCTPQSRMQEEPGYYGVRVDTEKYAYLLRLNPDRGEYNLYCYCYRRDWLDHHLKDAEKGIRFIDSHYKELFRIPDGGKVKIHYSWNEEQIRTCRYIDDYHVEIGSNLYHICEFAERMEYGGHTCEPIRDNLPEQCYSVLSGSDKIIIIKRGEKGYFKTDIPVTDKDEARSIVNEYNTKLGVSRSQEGAMKAGSMFGFQVPAADPRNYDADGKPVMPKDRGDAR